MTHRYTHFVCQACRTTFPWTNRNRLPTAQDCPNCHGNTPAAHQVVVAGQDRAELVPTGTGGALTKFVSQITGSQPQVGTADLKQLAQLAATPVEFRKRTIFEYLRGEDIVETQLQRKAHYSAAATKVARDRTELINSIIEMFSAADRLSRAEIEVEVDRAKQRVQLRKLQVEEQDLEERSEHQRALREGRLRTSELEERKRQHEIRVSITPAEPEPDPTVKAVQDERRRLQAAARGREALVSDCLRRVNRIHNSKKLDAHERALRINSVIDAYGLERADLPPAIQEFLNALEDSERV